jgi:HEAT repeat protein
LFELLTMAMATLVAAVLPAQDPPAAAPVLPPGPNAYQFPGWRADFPVALAWPLRTPGLAYDRSRQKALSRIVANLRGNVRREVWLFATEFFARAPDEAVDLLIEAMDRAYPNLAEQDVVKNTVEAMGKMGRERFDAALQRALEHPGVPVQQAAYAALCTSGLPATVRKMYPWFLAMNGKARESWLRAVRLRLPGEAAAMFRELLLRQDVPPPVQDQVLKEALRLPVGEAAAVLKPRWADATGEFKAVVAGVLHGALDAAGSTWLRDALRSPDPKLVELALRQCGRGDLGPLREDVLRLSLHESDSVRLHLVRLLAQFQGDDVTSVLETLSAPGQVPEVQGLVLRELVRRGRPDAVSVLLDELPTLTGTRLNQTLGLLSTSGDPRAVPLLLQRFRQQKDGEGREFLQAIAFGNSPAAFAALAEVFRGPERAVAPPGPGGARLTTLDYPPTLMMNLRGSEERFVELWHGLPADDLTRRGLLLPLLAGIAADRSDPAIGDPLIAIVREVLFDRAAACQLRAVALDQLSRRWLTLDDAMRLKAMLPQETPPMRAYLSDWLLEYF